MFRSISKTICTGDNLDDLIKNINLNHQNLGLTEGDTFKIEVYSYGKIYTQEEKLEKIEVQ